MSKLPVLALRWSQDKMSSNACFYDGSSIYFAVDELVSAPLPTNQGPPLSQTTIPPCVDGACLLELHKGNRSKVVMVPKTMTVKELAMQMAHLWCAYKHILTCVRCCWRRLGSHSTIRPLCGNADAAQLRLDANTRCCQNTLESSLRINRAQPPRGPPPKHGLLSRSRSGQKKEI
jgi:hypothetical protein